ncbi:hypothetical protein K443DRAFT_677196 [Laccaria amethystina LaAM-08-1]|uniref:EGF-like domain-containing protein n=1 Tax=Laccaria amethystina LaAM-08-1 TaxID=1095629 RepID=A0A0C9Y427_9AGAR|nr:hypothetical protein K443DRAFT_677196 [Laccaria amethystina LaAM-08-1]
MKSYYAVAVSMFFANGIIQMAAGLDCSSSCAACWLDNNNDGVDTKFTCTGNGGVGCGDVCPTGYNGIHCAKSERCVCVSTQATDCDEFGPCQCGAFRTNARSYSYLSCGSIDASGNC